MSTSSRTTSRPNRCKGRAARSHLTAEPRRAKAGGPGTSRLAPAASRSTRVRAGVGLGTSRRRRVRSKPQSRGAFVNLGGAWTSPRGFVGANYGYDDTRYGIPFVEEGRIQLTPRRHTVNLKAEARNLTGLFDSVRVSTGIRRYKHDELEGKEVGTQFRNDSGEFDALAGHRAFGRLKGSVGVWGLTRAFEATGAEALSHRLTSVPSRRSCPRRSPGRTSSSSSAPVSITRASSSKGESDRSDLQQLLGLGRIAPSAERRGQRRGESREGIAEPRPGRALFSGPSSGKLCVRARKPGPRFRARAGVRPVDEMAALARIGRGDVFRNDIADYIFRNPTGEVEEEFPSSSSRAPTACYKASSLIWTSSSHRFSAPKRGWTMSGAELKASGDPLPRMPPLRGRLGLRYQRNALQAGGEVMTAAAQEKVSEETPTDGYTLLKLFASYSFTSGSVLSTVTARFENVTNELSRNHLSSSKISCRRSRRTSS